MDLFTLRRLCRELSTALCGARIDGLDRLDPRRLRLRAGARGLTLVFDETLCAGWLGGGPGPALLLTTSLRYMGEALGGSTVREILAEPGRLRLLAESRAGEVELSLIGPPRSFLLVFVGGEARAGYRRPMDREWQAHLPAFEAGATEEAPSIEALERWRASHGEALLGASLARLSLGLTPPLAREVLHRAGGAVPSAVRAAALEVLAEARGTGPIWLYRRGERPGLVSAVRLAHDPRDPEKFELVGEAAERLDSQDLEPERLQVARRTAARPSEMKAARLARALEKLDGERLEMAEAPLLERQAHSLLAFGARLGRGSSNASLPDASDPAVHLEIPLDPTRTGVENATVLLRRAAKMGRRHDALERRRAEVTQQQAAQSGMAESILAAATWQRLEDLGVLEEERKAPESKEDREEASRGEVYRVTSTEGWAVLIGKNAAQNEFLTHRLARQNDYWFHAEHVSGSHVVLRRDSQPGEPSHRTLEEVAGYAAFFSKARTSSRAPVILAEKKYVRKARGAPGKVTVERGKTIMARPAKPAG